MAWFKKDDKHKAIAQMSPNELETFVKEMEKASAELEVKEKELNDLAETLSQKDAGLSEKENSLKTFEQELMERSKKIGESLSNTTPVLEIKKFKHAAELLSHAKLAKIDNPEKFPLRELLLEIIQRGFPFGIGTATHNLSQNIIEERLKMAVESLKSKESKK